jgi:hypothetical protein
LRRLDPLGLFLFVPSMVCLILALQWAGSSYRWSSAKIIGLLVAFAVLFVIFLIIEGLTSESAMIPPRVVLNRSIAGSMIFMFLLSGAVMAVTYYLTIWFQIVKGDSAMHAGVSTIPMVLSLVLASIPSAVLTQKIGYYVPNMLICPILSSVGAGLLSTLTPSSNHRYWIGFQFLYGFGVGWGFQSSNLAAQTVLSRADVPIGMALVFFMQQIGGSVFLAVGQNLFATNLVNGLSGIGGLDQQTIIDTGATDLRNMVPTEQLNTVVNVANHALTRVFIMVAALSACMILASLAVEWKSIKGKKAFEPSTKSAESGNVKCKGNGGGEVEGKIHNSSTETTSSRDGTIDKV